jgi:hypothetical protein
LQAALDAAIAMMEGQLPANEVAEEDAEEDEDGDEEEL